MVDFRRKIRSPSKLDSLTWNTLLDTLNYVSSATSDLGCLDSNSHFLSDALLSCHWHHCCHCHHPHIYACLTTRHVGPIRCGELTVQHQSVLQFFIVTALFWLHCLPHLCSLTTALICFTRIKVPPSSKVCNLETTAQTILYRVPPGHTPSCGTPSLSCSDFSLLPHLLLEIWILPGVLYLSVSE